MMDFTAVKGVTIPEGVVTQITDASGRLMWGAETDSTATVRLTALITDMSGGLTDTSNYLWVKIDGVKYYAPIADPITLTVRVGTVIEVYLAHKSSAGVCTLKVNGDTIHQGSGTSYEHTVTKDTVVGLIYMHSIIGTSEMASSSATISG